MNESTTDHYQEIASIALEKLDAIITEEVQERLDRDPDFPSWAEDEEGEAYILEAIRSVERAIRARLDR